MLTRAHADVRQNTQNADIAAVCDWVLSLVQRCDEVAATPPAAPKADRKAYMGDYMRRRREAGKR